MSATFHFRLFWRVQVGILIFLGNAAVAQERSSTPNKGEKKILLRSLGAPVQGTELKAIITLGEDLSVVETESRNVDFSLSKPGCTYAKKQKKYRCHPGRVSSFKVKEGISTPEPLMGGVHWENRQTCLSTALSITLQSRVPMRVDLNTLALSIDGQVELADVYVGGKWTAGTRLEIAAHDQLQLQITPRGRAPHRCIQKRHEVRVVRIPVFTENEAQIVVARATIASAQSSSEALLAQKKATPEPPHPVAKLPEPKKPMDYEAAKAAVPVQEQLAWLGGGAGGGLATGAALTAAYFWIVASEPDKSLVHDNMDVDSFIRAALLLSSAGLLIGLSAGAGGYFARSFIKEPYLDYDKELKAVQKTNAENEELALQHRQWRELTGK